MRSQIDVTISQDLAEEIDAALLARRAEMNQRARDDDTGLRDEFLLAAKAIEMLRAEWQSVYESARLSQR